MRLSITHLVLCNSLFVALSGCCETPAGQPTNAPTTAKDLPISTLEQIRQNLEEEKRLGSLVVCPKTKIPAFDIRQPMHFRVTMDFFAKFEQMLADDAKWAQAFQVNHPSEGAMIQVARRFERKELFDFLTKLYDNGSIKVVPDAKDPEVLHVHVDGVTVEDQVAPKIADMLAKYQKKANIKDETIKANKDLFIRSLVDIMSRMIQSFEKGDKQFEFISPKDYIIFIFQALKKQEYFEQVIQEILKFVNSKGNALSLDKYGAPSMEKAYEAVITGLAKLLEADAIEILDVNADSCKIVINFEKLRDSTKSEGEVTVESASESEEAEEEEAQKSNPTVNPKQRNSGSSSSEEEVVVIKKTKTDGPSPVTPEAANEKPPKKSAAAVIGYSTLLLASSMLVLLL